MSDREWVLDGAAVNISMIGFDSGGETDFHLDGRPVANINADLTANADTTQAMTLPENKGLCFLGMMKAGPFDIDFETAQQMLAAPSNPNGRPNSDVVKRRIGGQEVTGRSTNTWIIDFGVNTSKEVAALYELPFEYVRKHVKPIRDVNRRERFKLKWWLFGETRSGLRAALLGRTRCIITPEVAKHRIFVWMDVNSSPDHTLHVIARDDDYFFGILQSRLHEIWSLHVGSTLEDRPRYSSSRTFETFPFPWPPGHEPQDEPRVQAVANAARELVQLRETQSGTRTLTQLYNERPTWLDNAHRKLDAAVFAAYGWPADLSDDDILARLLALNLERAAG
jgi:type II restriction/modification system DNA methylase subunit YeeA